MSSWESWLLVGAVLGPSGDCPVAVRGLGELVFLTGPAAVEGPAGAGEWFV